LVDASKKGQIGFIVGLLLWNCFSLVLLSVGIYSSAQSAGKEKEYKGTLPTGGDDVVTITKCPSIKIHILFEKHNKS